MVLMVGGPVLYKKVMAHNDRALEDSVHANPNKRASILWDSLRASILGSEVEIADSEL